jgi:hypothetical protein
VPSREARTGGCDLGVHASLGIAAEVSSQSRVRRPLRAHLSCSQGEERTELRRRTERIYERLTASERKRGPELIVDLRDDPRTLRFHPPGKLRQLLECSLVASRSEPQRDHRTFIQARWPRPTRDVHRCRGLPGHQLRRSRSLKGRESTP